jgi:hypothetical protein
MVHNLLAESVEDDDENDDEPHSKRKRYKEVNSAAISASSNTKPKDPKYMSNLQKKKPPPLVDYESPPLIFNHIEVQKEKGLLGNEDQIEEEKQEFNKTGTFKVNSIETNEREGDQDQETDSPSSDRKKNKENVTNEQQMIEKKISVESKDRPEPAVNIPNLDSPTCSSLPTELGKCDISRQIHTTNPNEDIIQNTRNDQSNNTDFDMKTVDGPMLENKSYDNRELYYEERNYDYSHGISDRGKYQHIGTIEELKKDVRSPDETDKWNILKQIHIREAFEKSPYNLSAQSIAKNIREIKESSFVNLTPLQTQDSNHKHLTSVTEFDKEQVSRYHFEDPSNDSRLKDTLASKRSEVVNLTEIFRKQTGRLNSKGNEAPQESLRRRIESTLKSRPNTERPHYLQANNPYTYQRPEYTEKDIVTFRTSREPDVPVDAFNRFVYNEKKRKEASIREFKLNLEKIVSEVRNSLFNDNPASDSDFTAGKSSSSLNMSTNNFLKYLPNSKRIGDSIPSAGITDRITSRREAFNLLSPEAPAENLNFTENMKASSPKELSNKKIEYTKSPISDELRRFYGKEPETSKFGTDQQETNAFNSRKSVLEDYINKYSLKSGNNNHVSRPLVRDENYQNEKPFSAEKGSQKIINMYEVGDINTQKYYTPKKLDHRVLYESRNYVPRQEVEERYFSKDRHNSNQKFDSAKYIEELRNSIRGIGPIIQEDMNQEEKRSNQFIAITN